MKVLAPCIVALALVAGACGGGGDDGGGPSASSEGEERTVLVDYHHDEFASAFLQYYPRDLKVHAGDTVHFKQAWSGEPHSVTMGKVVNDVFEVAPLVEEYDSAEDARAGGLAEDIIQRAIDVFSKLPGMTGDGFTIFQPGARPCYVSDMADVPEFSDIESERPNPDAKCPTEGEPQPAFDGAQALYNSGFISPTGESANRFDVPIAEGTAPGTYRYFCNYHWVGMSGTIEVVADDAKIPSQDAVNAQARKEITETSKPALTRVRAARKGDFGKLTPPLAGRAPLDEDSEEPEAYVIVNEFLPKTVKAKVDKPVTWTLDGSGHTVSFNVPKYFPVFTVEKSGDVEWNPKSYEPVGWDIPDSDDSGPGPRDGEEEPRKVDVGKWDGKGGFHSSGVLAPGETFTLTFTKAGTYPYACVLHPQMVGTVEVSA
jgi:plastocyanin